MMPSYLNHLLDVAFANAALEASAVGEALGFGAGERSNFNKLPHDQFDKIQALSCLAKIMACYRSRDEAQSVLYSAALAFTDYFAKDSALPLMDYSAPVVLQQPSQTIAPVLITLPHSGRDYSAAFLKASALSLPDLRRSEDAFVDVLVDNGVGLGALLLKAQFPRALVDVNREPFELDAAMFDAALPAFVNTNSLRVAGGLGTIPRLVGEGLQIYRDKLPVSAMWQVLAQYYLPYHAAMMDAVAALKRRFGAVVIIDCHSMPSSAVTMRDDHSAGKWRRNQGQAYPRAGVIKEQPQSEAKSGKTKSNGARPDFVLGDRYGTSCQPALIDVMETALRARGYHVARNTPYAGGFITETYGKPHLKQQAVQMEICRDLYMDEETLTLHHGAMQLQADLAEVFTTVIAYANSLVKSEARDNPVPVAIAAE